METIYPNASSVPLAEDPPMDDVMRQFLSAVLSQARGCLPGLSATHKHGATAPEEVLSSISLRVNSPTTPLFPPGLHLLFRIRLFKTFY
jgi:hypothetical protein